ncbi:outer membrane lipoprotein LolB [Alteromonadales bacterium alter-6D02]|nr:outer membrane lipoprotein LolB [Alteromonadales bacterium alter-6D02]
MALSLSGCSTFIKQPPIDGPITQQWQFNGKFAIRTPQETQSAKIHWAQLNQQYDINLYTTLGITVMKITGNDNFVEIDGIGEEPITGTSAEQLIWQLTRWHIPVSQLQWWVQGKVPYGSNINYNKLGQVTDAEIIDNNGQTWQLRLGKYQSVDGKQRPYTIGLTQDRLFLKLAITKWQIQQ